MPNFVLILKNRKTGAKSLLSKIKKNSRLAAVVYGFGTKPLAVDADYNEALKVIKGAGTSHMIDLEVEGQKLLAIVRDYQQHPVTEKLIHVDFLAVSDKKPLVTFVPVELVGVSRAVKELGCKLNVKNDRLKVRCLPKDLPEKFVIDLSILSEVGKALQVADVPVAPGVKVLNNPKDPVVSVTIPKQIEEIAAAPTETAADATAATTAEAPTGEEKAVEPGQTEDKK